MLGASSSIVISSGRGSHGNDPRALRPRRCPEPWRPINPTGERSMSAAALALRYPSIRLLREAARARLPKPVFDFADGGAEDEVTLGRNEAAFRRWSFLPRPLEGAATRDQSVRLFGQSLSLPVLIGPTGLAGLFWPRGEIASAQAA